MCLILTINTHRPTTSHWLWCKINNLSDKLVLVGNIDGWLMSYLAYLNMEMQKRFESFCTKYITFRGSLRNVSLSSNLISRAHREEFELLINYSEEQCCFVVRYEIKYRAMKTQLLIELWAYCVVLRWYRCLLIPLKCTENEFGSTQCLMSLLCSFASSGLLREIMSLLSRCEVALHAFTDNTHSSSHR